METAEKKNYIIFTGAPGSGKTTLINELAALGGKFVPEPARQIIAEQRKAHGKALPDKDPNLFTQELLSRSIEQFNGALTLQGPIYFDRGIPDVIAYARWYGLDLNEIEKACQSHRYHSQIFMLPPWEDIYSTDEERKMTFEQSVRFHGFLEDAYKSSNYQLIEVPCASAKIRADFVLGKLRA